MGPIPVSICILSALVSLAIIVCKVGLGTLGALGGRCAIDSPSILVFLVCLCLGSVSILVSTASLTILVSLVRIVILVIPFGLVRLIGALKWYKG